MRHECLLRPSFFLYLEFGEAAQLSIARTGMSLQTVLRLTTQDVALSARSGHIIMLVSKMVTFDNCHARFRDSEGRPADMRIAILVVPRACPCEVLDVEIMHPAVLGP